MRIRQKLECYAAGCLIEWKTVYFGGAGELRGVRDAVFDETERVGVKVMYPFSSLLSDALLQLSEYVADLLCHKC